MKKGLVVVLVLVLGLVLATGLMAAEKAKPSGMKEQVINMSATVEAIDLNKRIVTLKGSQGNVFDLKVGEEAKNLAQVKVGDQVNVKYYESLAYEVKKAGAATGGAEATGAVATAKPGEKPAGVVAGQVTVTATIEKIDTKKQYVSLKMPEGKILEVKVKDPNNLKNVKKGDQVVLTYTEALALSVEPAKKK
jgi:Cu/Ag efflux protein CusF